MFLGVPTQPSCARAWVAAASAISGDIDAYNVVVDVDDPTKFDERDSAVIALVDTFLRDRDLNSISTITNTIFPDALFQQHGAPKFYEVYHTQVYDKLTSSKGWGRYFERLTLTCGPSMRPNILNRISMYRATCSKNRGSPHRPRTVCR